MTEEYIEQRLSRLLDKSLPEVKKLIDNINNECNLNYNRFKDSINLFLHTNLEEKMVLGDDKETVLVEFAHDESKLKFKVDSINAGGKDRK